MPSCTKNLSLEEHSWKAAAFGGKEMNLEGEEVFSLCFRPVFAISITSSRGQKKKKKEREETYLQHKPVLTMSPDNNKV